MKNKYVLEKLAFLMVIISILVGCTTQAINRNVPIAEIHKDGTISVEGIVISVDQLPTKLVNLGFTPDMTIKIQVPDPKPTDIMKAITSRLKNAGFGRIMFVSTRHVTSAVRNKTDNMLQTK